MGMNFASLTERDHAHGMDQAMVGIDVTPITYGVASNSCHQQRSFKILILHPVSQTSQTSQSHN